MPWFQTVAVSVEKLTVYFILFSVFCILELFCLQLILFTVPFQSSLDNVSKICRLLADPCQGLPGGIEGADHPGDGVKRFLPVVGKMSQRQSRKFFRFIFVVIYGGRKLKRRNLLHIIGKLLI